MPQGYGFLKYGRPMAAAAPLLLALSSLPTTTHACTGNANDPVFCSQVDGQFVTGVGAFIDNNLTGVPGSSPIPGSTPALDDDNDFGGDFTNPIDDDNDFDFLLLGEDGFSETGFVRTPLENPPAFYPEDLAPSFNEDSGFNTVANTSIGAGTPVATIPITGIPEFQGTSAPAPVQGQQFQFYGFSPSGPGPNQFNIVINPESNTLSIAAPDGSIPAPIQNLVDQASGTDSGGSCSIASPACQVDLGQMYITITNVMPAENVAPVLNALANGTPSTEAQDRVAPAVTGADGDPADTAGLRTYYQTVERNPAPAPSSGSGSGSRPEGDSFVARQVASINKLREEAANAPDPETRQAKQAELQRKEAAIRQYGSAAVRNALGLGDARSAPVPGRN